MTDKPNLPQVQRLKFEDYNHAANWQDAIKGLIGTLNLFMQPVYNILNGQVTYQNLVVPQTYTVTITATATTTFTFKNPLTINPTGVILGNCWAGISSTHPAVALQVYWHFSQGSIIVDNVVGLSSGTKYTLSLVIF